MIAFAVAAHALSIAHGFGAGLLCAACLYLGGLACMPRRWAKALGDGESPAMLGAAVYVIACWFGITFGITLAHLGMGFASVVLLLAVVRYRSIAAALQVRAVLTRGVLGWLGAFGLLYVLAYLFTMPPATSEYLPPAWTGNIDMMTYMRYTTHLLRLGPANLAGFSYLDWVYLQTPAVFYFLGGLSLLYGRDAMSAVMPAQFGLMALTGVFIARISRSIFRVSRGSAVAIACIFVSGPFFRYVTGAYFLSTMMSMPVLLFLLFKTAAYHSSRLLDNRAVLQFGSAYVLLLFMYPFLLFVGVAAQVALVVLTFFAESQAARGWSTWREATRNAGRTASAVLLSCGLVSTLLLSASGVVGRYGSVPLEGGRRGLAARHHLAALPCWACPDRVPIAVRCRTPLTAAGRLGSSASSRWPWPVCTSGGSARRRRPQQRTLVGLASGSFLLYSAYFVSVGPSYQQWKFASYTALPLSFVVFTGGWQLLQQSGAFARATRTPLWAVASSPRYSARSSWCWLAATSWSTRSATRRWCDSLGRCAISRPWTQIRACGS